VIDKNQANLNAIEKHFDNVLDRLPIFRLPSEIALYSCLTELECIFYDMESIHDRLSSHAAMLHVKAALQFLIPRIYRHCPHSDSIPIKKYALQFLSTASQAMNFCERCSALEDCFILYHRNWFEGSVDDRIVTFAYP
jgi:hypothetical protein